MTPEYKIKAWFQSRAMEAKEQRQERLIKQAVDNYLEEHLDKLIADRN